MPLEVWTARISTADPDRFDITRKSADEGIIFAPSWAILRPALDARDAAREFRESGMIGADIAADQHEAEAWAAYVPAYTAEMRASYRANREAWGALLARHRVVLVCYCVDPEHCHRALLAGILGKLGADVRGELPPPPPKLAPAGGMTHDTADALRRRAAKRRAG